MGIYSLLQFHFHAPSENTVDGKFHDMEAHLVHRSAHGESLVLAQFFDVGHANDYFAQFWEDFPEEIGTYEKDIPIDSPYEMLTNEMLGSYYMWEGSLTTPPCTAGLVWILGKTPGRISFEQFTQFRDVLSNLRSTQDRFEPGYVPPGVTKATWDSSKGWDNRPTQPIGNRVIYTHSEFAEPSSVPKASQEAVDESRTFFP